MRLTMEIPASLSGSRRMLTGVFDDLAVLHGEAELAKNVDLQRKITRAAEYLEHVINVLGGPKHD